MIILILYRKINFNTNSKLKILSELVNLKNPTSLIRSLKMQDKPKFNVDVKLGIEMYDSLLKKLKMKGLNTKKDDYQNYSRVIKELLHNKEYYCETEGVISINRTNISGLNLGKHFYLYI